MEKAHAVTRDPTMPDPSQQMRSTPPCFACNSTTRKKGRLHVYLDSSQVNSRASVDTGDIANPFASLSKYRGAQVLLCTDCRSSTIGWQVICNPRRYGCRVAAIALRKWNRRCQLQSSQRNKPVCFICSCVSTENLDKDTNESNRRNPTCDWTIFNLAMCSETSREIYITEFQRLSSAKHEDIVQLLSFPTEKLLCPTHLNHSRYAQNAVHKADKSLRGRSSGFCVFTHVGCNGSDGRLRKLPEFNFNLQDLDAFAAFEDSVSVLTSNRLTASDALGKYACSHCLYFISDGKDGKAPTEDTESLKDLADIWLVRCIRSALESSPNLSNTIIQMAKLSRYSDAANELRERAVVPLIRNSNSDMRMIFFKDVLNCRSKLCSVIHAGKRVTIDPRTVESRIRSVLSSSRIHLKKLSPKVRVYVIADKYEQSLASSCTSQTKGVKELDFSERTKLLDQVAKQFVEKKEKYWAGDWSLSSEICDIPPRLWGEFVLQMTSHRRVTSLEVTASALGRKLESIFPVSNRSEHLPCPSIEHCLSQGSTDYRRADLLISIRALKVIEQVVFSRTNSVSGPLTVCLSISGIVELSPSFVSVQNALGHTLSYTVTEAYRLKLIAERERARRGAWQNLDTVNEDCLPTCQFDNWDILPLHAVKASGKRMPKVNGSLLQGVSRRKRMTNFSEMSNSAKRTKTNGWDDPKIHGTREEFASSLTSKHNCSILDDFIDIAFGAAFTFRAQLLGGIDNDNSDTDHFPLTHSNKRGIAINFRTLMLSAFKPHGGRNALDDNLFEQEIFYVDVNQESAADILTVRRTIDLIQRFLTPGKPGCPRHVVLSGDQPSFKMFMEIWLSSWRQSNTQGYVAKENGELLLHEWLVPFPGFFHVEKQGMHPLCKEMLDGIGLQELAECVGLSSSHVSNILKHSHARNNRALLFNLSCAMLTHMSDILITECPEVKDKIQKIIEEGKRRKRVETESGLVLNMEHPKSKTSTRSPQRGLKHETSDLIDDSTLEIGTFLHRESEKFFSKGPNAKHFVTIVLFICLHPTLGFHVLSRTGHTDYIEAFWFRMNYILYTSGHLKYQELSAFYAFIRGIFPESVISELFREKPGSSVVRLESFTSTGRNRYLRGWCYVHLDEALEMMIVRHLKSLSVSFLRHLETSAAWLLEVSRFRSLARYITGASRTYGRFRGADDTGESSTGPLILSPLNQYDKTAVQWRTVHAMIEKMRNSGFLFEDHRNCEWICNVFSSPQTRMNNAFAQKQLLTVFEHGKVTAGLHASVLFPEVFGELTQEDIKTFFKGKKFKKWTKSRRVETPGTVMRKDGGSMLLTGQEQDDGITNLALKARPKDKSDGIKRLTERRRFVSKAKDALHIAERKASQANDEEGRAHAAKRWDSVHYSRHLVSSTADGFRTHNGGVQHAQKSRILKVVRAGERGTSYTLNDLLPPRRDRANVSQHILDVNLSSYFSIQVDVMNAIHYRGDDGGRGTNLEDIVVGKMKNILRKWVVGRRALALRQIHLHIDDPDLVILQKSTEQARRDTSRLVCAKEGLGNMCESSRLKDLPNFNDELVLPWSRLIQEREYKDQLACLHLFCGAVALEEILTENSLPATVFLHGGAFALRPGFYGRRPSSFRAIRSNGREPIHLKGHVILEDKLFKGHEDDWDDMYYKELASIPRSRALIYDTLRGLRVSNHQIQHGEAETRFVRSFKTYIQPELPEFQHSFRPGVGYVIISDDTDVFIILLLSQAVKGFGVIHIIKDTIHDVDVAKKRIEAAGTDDMSIATIYAFSGCDFSPGTNGIGHEVYLEAYINNIEAIKKFGKESPLRSYETLMCLAYLYKCGMKMFLSPTQRNKMSEELLTKVLRHEIRYTEMQAKLRKAFVSTYVIGSDEWLTDVRNAVSDRASSVFDLIPPKPFILLQAFRSEFLVHGYWGLGEHVDLRPQTVGGCDPLHGYTDTGEVLLERQEDVLRLKKEICSVISFCGCKGDCTSQRCSCKKSKKRCIGCNCLMGVCKNGVGACRNSAEINEDDNITDGDDELGNDVNEEASNESDSGEGSGIDFRAGYDSNEDELATQFEEVDELLMHVE